MTKPPDEADEEWEIIKQMLPRLETILDNTPPTRALCISLSLLLTSAIRSECTPEFLDTCMRKILDAYKDKYKNLEWKILENIIT